MRKTILILEALVFSLLIFACSTITPDKKKYGNTINKHSLPKVPPKVVPGGTDDNWRYLGLSSDGNIAIEINDTSIRNNSSFEDRKTILSPSKFDYQNLTPPYKYNLSWWKIDCNKKTYLITASSIYDLYGNLLKNYSFTNYDKWQTITNDSIISHQYDYICKGITRNLGY